MTATDPHFPSVIPAKLKATAAILLQLMEIGAIDQKRKGRLTMGNILSLADLYLSAGDLGLRKRDIVEIMAIAKIPRGANGHTNARAIWNREEIIRRLATASTDFAELPQPSNVAPDAPVAPFRMPGIDALAQQQTPPHPGV